MSHRSAGTDVPWTAALAWFVLSGACGDGERSACDARLAVPDGFCATLFADDVGPARHLAVSTHGTVYVALWREGRRTGGVLALGDTNDDGRADLRERFGPEGGSGISVRDSLLYFATWSTVYRYVLRADALLPVGAPEVVVSELPEIEHGARSIAVDGAGRLFVNIGAPSNACERDYPGRDLRGDDPCRELRTSGGVWAFDGLRIGHRFGDGQQYATGLRHTVALALHPSGVLFGAPHGIDHLHSWWPAAGFTREDAARVPSETLFRIEEGGDYGWPYCMHDPRSARMVRAPAYRASTVSDDRCRQIVNPLATFPAHSAPLALVFYTPAQFPSRYRNGLFVALHGSLFHHPLPPVGYRVDFLPFAEDQPSGPVETFAKAGTAVGGRWRRGALRPSGLAVDSAGSLYIADDNAGRVWKVRWTRRRG